MSAAQFQIQIITLPDGVRAGVVSVVPPEDAPPAVREGFARRAMVNGGGVCPCGARMVIPNRAERRRGRTTRAVTVHEDDCPATEQNLRHAISAAGL